MTDTETPDPDELETDDTETDDTETDDTETEAPPVGIVSSKPAPDGEPVGSLAVVDDKGTAPGHKGLGTGDGPAGG
jgi:hypothetical protein